MYGRIVRQARICGVDRHADGAENPCKNAKIRLRRALCKKRTRTETRRIRRIVIRQFIKSYKNKSYRNEKNEKTNASDRAHFVLLKKFNIWLP